MVLVLISILGSSVSTSKLRTDDDKTITTSNRLKSLLSVISRKKKQDSIV